MSNYNASFIGQLASGVWQYDINSPTNISALSISGYFVSNIGRFNNLVGTCFIGTGCSGINGGMGDAPFNYDVVDPNNPSGDLLGDNEADILRHIYLITYYQGVINSMSGPGIFFNGGTLSSTQSLPVQMLKEGDSTIQFVNAAQIMSNYQKMLDSEKKTLNYLVEAYKVNSLGSSIPRTLAFYNISTASYSNTYNSYLQ